MSNEQPVAATDNVTMASTSVERLAETDRLTLDLAKSKYETAVANTERAQAKQESAELAYRYFVLQLFTKYGLTASDAVKDDGTIVRDGNSQAK